MKFNVLALICAFAFCPIIKAFADSALKTDTIYADQYCHKDGVHDDAETINGLIENEDVHIIYFSKGTYLLESFHNSKYPVNKPYHIGINRSNLQLIGEDGAILKTKTMAGTLNIYSQPYHLENRVHDISIMGITFEVENDSTSFNPYQEHCHTISTMGCFNLKIMNCKFLNFWGDAICTNHFNDNEKTGERQRNESILIINNYFDGKNHSNRNGVSIINGRDITIEKNSFINCAHSSMPGAIDIEPNFGCFTCRDITIKDNYINHCGGCNAAISICGIRNGISLDSIYIKNNKIYNSLCGFTLVLRNSSTSKVVEFEDNYIDKNTPPFFFSGNGEATNWTVKNNKFEKSSDTKFPTKIKFTNLTEKNNKISYSFDYYKNLILSIF